MTGGFWDRVTGRRVRLLPHRPLLGRYQLAAPGVVNGLDAAAYSYVAPDNSWRWSVSASGCAGEGHFESDAIPGQVLATSTAAVATALTKEIDRSPVVEPSEFDRWAAVTPVATELMAQIRSSAEDDPVLVLEKELDASLEHLEEVCHRPQARLRYESTVTPVSRVRHLAPDAITHLAAHTEDWERRTIRGVRPRRLLALHTGPDLDLYENQLVVQLIDHLLVFLDWRASKLRTATDMLEGLDDLARQLEDRDWRTGFRLSTLVGEFVASPDLWAEAQELLGRTEQRRARISRLRVSPLYRDRNVKRHSTMTPDLRQTNLLTHHRHYRRVGALWRAWARASRHAGVDEAVQPSRFCSGYDQFAALLVCRALSTLDYMTRATHAPRPGGPDLRYTGPSEETLVLGCPPDGTIELHRDGKLLATFVPLAHPLTADQDAVELGALANELDQAKPPEDSMRFVLYPGTGEQARELVSPLLTGRADTVGNDLPGGAGVGLLPVAPTQIDSIERVIRAIRWATMLPDVRAYPPIVPCSSDDLRREIIGWQLPWLVAGSQATAVIFQRPPNVEEQAEIGRRLSTWLAERQPPDKRRERQSAAMTFRREVEKALQVLHRLARCPVCGTTANPRLSFHPQNEKFFVNCQRCKNAWGKQQCPWCPAVYPFVRLRRRSSGGGLVGMYAMGNEVLAVTCRLGSEAGAYICPRCGKCGAAATRSAAECQRCDHAGVLPASAIIE